MLGFDGSLLSNIRAPSTSIATKTFPWYSPPSGEMTGLPTCFPYLPCLLHFFLSVLAVGHSPNGLVSQV